MPSFNYFHISWMYHWHNHNWQLIQTQQWFPGSWSKSGYGREPKWRHPAKPPPPHPHRVSFPPTLYNTKTKGTYWGVPPLQNKDAKSDVISQVLTLLMASVKTRWVLGMIAGYYTLLGTQWFQLWFSFQIWVYESIDIP